MKKYDDCRYGHCGYPYDDNFRAVSNYAINQEMVKRTIIKIGKLEHI